MSNRYKIQTYDHIKEYTSSGHIVQYTLSITGEQLTIRLIHAIINGVRYIPNYKQKKENIMRYSDTLRRLSMVLSEVPDKSIALCLCEAADKIDILEKTLETNKSAVKSINEAILVINKMQDKATNPSGTDQSMPCMI